MKFIKITAIILIIVALLIGIYFIWRYLISPETPFSLEKEPGEATAEIGLLKPLGTQAALDYWIKSNGEIYFITLTGEIYKISSAGKEEKIASQTIAELSRVKASADGSKALISFGYPFQETFTVFNALDKTWQPLLVGTAAAAWHPSDSNQLALLKVNGNQSSLIIYNLKDKKSKEIIKISQKDLTLDWVLPEEIYLTERPSAETANSLWAVNISKKTIRPLIKEVNGLIVNWFNNGQNGLKFSSANRGGILEVIDKNGQSLVKLPVVTLPEKCVVGLDDVYCAASPDFPEAVLPDDYLKIKNFSPDNLYFILKGSEKDSINIYNSSLMSAPLDIQHLEIKNNQLIFINRLDNKLYSLEL